MSDINDVQDISATWSAYITRADGSVEDLGVICEITERMPSEDVTALKSILRGVSLNG